MSDSALFCCYCLVFEVVRVLWDRAGITRHHCNSVIKLLNIFLILKFSDSSVYKTVRVSNQFSSQSIIICVNSRNPPQLGILNIYSIYACGRKPHPIIDCYTHPGQTCSNISKLPLVAKVLLYQHTVSSCSCPPLASSSIRQSIIDCLIEVIYFRSERLRSSSSEGRPALDYFPESC